MQIRRAIEQHGGSTMVPRLGHLARQPLHGRHIILKRAKALIKQALSPAIRREIRDVWEDWRDWVQTFTFGLSYSVTRTPRPKTLLYFGYAPGDDLLCTAVLRELRKRGRDRLLIISDHQELFMDNPDPAHVRPLWARYSRDGSTVSVCRRFTRIWGGEFIRLEYAPIAGIDRRIPPSRHIIAGMCARAGVSGLISIRPYLRLNEDEKSAAAWARDRIVIQSSGINTRHPMRNKQWYAERFQAVIDVLNEELEFIQIGSAADPPLRGVRDLRGATKIREAAAILYHARLYVGTVGFLMHLARAVECPSVIIFGGREAPWQSGYSCNCNLYSEVPCAPCWRSNTCEFDHRCMNDISVDDVVSSIRQMLSRSRNPLEVDTIDITPEYPPEVSSSLQSKPAQA